MTVYQFYCVDSNLLLYNDVPLFVYTFQQHASTAPVYNINLVVLLLMYVYDFMVVFNHIASNPAISAFFTAKKNPGRLSLRQQILDTTAIVSQAPPQRAGR